MVSIKDRKILRQMFSHYDYVMTTAQLSKEKLYYRDIQRMLKAGLIEKVKRGYYHWTMGSGKGDVVIISRLFPDGILYMETALFYYGYSDRNPAEWNIAIDKNASRQRTRIDYPSIRASCSLVIPCAVLAFLIARPIGVKSKSKSLFLSSISSPPCACKIVLYIFYRNEASYETV